MSASKHPLPLAVYLLSACQALMMSSTSLMVTISALVGYELAADKSLATLPLSLQFLGLMLTSIPASLIMGRWGRRAGFMLGAALGIVGALTALSAVLDHAFWRFAAGAFLVGMFNGFGSYYRFAAVEVTDEADKPRAISWVLAGGVVAAFVGPNLANAGRAIFPATPFAGGFLFVVGFYLLVLLIMLIIRLPAAPSHNERADSAASARPLRIIARQPAFITAVICAMLGYAVMSYLMTATPLAMKHHHHVFDSTAFVIQWHVLAMFAPSFFTGALIQRFGLMTILLTGAALALLCIGTNLLGHTVWHFWLALVALGISWNFLFIGGTTLLTDTYRPEEKAKAQALNDFSVYTAVTIASLSAGYFEYNFGWKMVNLAALPLVGVILLSLLWLQRTPVERRVASAL